VDARTIYRGLDIGTAKPDVNERSEIPHYNVDVLEPSERDTPKAFEERILTQVSAFKHPVVFTGGSTLYLQQLLFGSDIIPERNESNTHVLNSLLIRRGKSFIVNWLNTVDPEYARQVDGFNGVRIFRALDVWLQSGRPFSSFHSIDLTKPRIPLVFGIYRPKELLKERIMARTHHMFSNGLVHEVSTLLLGGYVPESPGFRTIGYREVIEGLANGMSVDDMAHAVAKNTIAYAKRQTIFFKRWPFIQWFDANEQSTEEIVQAIVAKMGKFGAN
jgi:tRNA dimethylallyltransferase